MQSTDSIYITTPIYYVNDVPHLGHAYTTIICDALARYYRSIGKQVRFLTGTDEHGQKIEEHAQKKKITPQQLADDIHQSFKRCWDTLNISNDDFIRTTEDRHKKVVCDLWLRLRENDAIYLGHYNGNYCVGCEEYYTELQAPEQTCPIHQTPLRKISQPSYFFRMSAYQEPLLEHFKHNPEFVVPKSKRSEIMSFIESGLQDLSISRTSFKWGIPVPDDDTHVMYVWLDALTNYMSALGPFDPPSKHYKAFWPARHYIGKDILRFHAVYWPTILLAANLPLPKQIAAHGWWTVESEKMSKSKGNVIDPITAAKAVGTDALRYFLLRETTFGNDGDFSCTALTQRINADLANDLGNLVQRSITMNTKYLDAKLPESPGMLEDEDVQLKTLASKAKDLTATLYEENKPSEALEATWTLVRGLNKYISDTQPFTLYKDSRKHRRVQDIMYHLINGIQWVAQLIYPVMPSTSKMILRAICQEQIYETWPQNWLSLRPADDSQTTVAPKILFPRLDEDAKQHIRQQLMGPDKMTTDTPKISNSTIDEKDIDSKSSDALISINDFAKIKLAAAEVTHCEKIEGSDKLLLLRVDLGDHARQVVSGIADKFTAEELVGVKIVVVTNLKPAKIRGVKSEGMILAVGDKQVEQLVTLSPDTRLGAVIR